MQEPEQGEREATVDGVTYRPATPCCCAPARAATRRTTWSRAATRRSSASTSTSTGNVQLAVTVDGVPGQDLMRDIRRYLYFRPDEVEMTHEPHDFEKQILVAGVGNAWMQDDGFGSEAAQRLERRELPPGVTVMDFGSGGLDLAYEIMRGYHALVLIDVSRQGGEPGTLYVIEPDPADYARPIEDGEMISPHGMDPQTVLRFVNAVGGFSGKVVVVACEPGPIEDLAVGLSPEVELAVERAIDVVMEQIAELRTDEAYIAPDARAGDLLRGARVGAPARGRAARVRGQAARRAPAPGRAGLARVLLGDRDPRRPLRGLRAGAWS